MSVITMTATYTYNGQVLTSGQTYRVRARDAEQIVKAGKAGTATNKFSVPLANQYVKV